MSRVLIGILALAVTLVAGPQEPATPVPGAPGPGAQRPGPLPGGRMPGPPRDPRETATGTAAIRGRVVSADTGAPLRRVQVRAFSGEARESRMANTDGQGRFELRDLPAGRWELSAAKAGYVTLRFGQKRPFEAGRPIELADGDTMSRADFALPKGAVITGRILDEFGDPVASANVTAMRYQSMMGTRRLVPAGVHDQTDDTGAFRLFGLPPGEYYVSARVHDRSFAEQSTESTGYAATYYPGTGNMAEAQRVPVGVGQEQANISFALLPIRTVRITGTAIDSKGRPLANGFVMMVERTDAAGGFASMMSSGGRVRPDGSFTIANVTPGSYTLQIQAGMMGGPDQEFASTPITVGNEDLTGVHLVTSRGATVRGAVVAAEGTTGTIPSRGLQVFAQPRQFGPMMGMRPAAVDEDGTFTATGLSGTRLLRVNGLPPNWTQKAVLVDGVDVMDTGIEFRSDEEIADVQIVVTDRIGEVNGKVTDAKGQPTRDYTVIVFPDDPKLWEFPSRYVRSGRADLQGLFRIRPLPPHERYLAVAVDYLEEGEGGDPEFLTAMRDRASVFVLADGETRAIDLKLITR
jgi:protocatechuate 3,4-dioxygenase beta subunit